MTHAPNTPRERNSKGQKVDEPVQCVQCLQTWPCEVMLLSQQVIALASENRTLREQSVDAPVALYGQPGRKPICDFDCDYCRTDEGTDDENLRTWKEETGG